MMVLIIGMRAISSSVRYLSILKPKPTIVTLPSRMFSSKSTSTDEATIPDRPFTLPPGQFRPKQSLGQNYLSDQNYVLKIVDTFDQARREVIGEVDKGGQRVIEIGPGIGMNTVVLILWRALLCNTIKLCIVLAF